MKKSLIALGVAVLLAGCGSTATAEKPAAVPSYPTGDVLSGIAVDATAAASLPAAVRSRGTLILGTTITPGVNGLPHGGHLADGTDIGLDVDLRNAVGRVLGLRWDVRNGTFPTIIPGVQNGKYDVGMDNFGVTGPRERVVDFATYLTDGQAFLAPSSSDLNQVADITDLCGRILATSPGSTFQQILENSKAKCAAGGKKPYTVQYFADTAPIWLGLANGKIDVYFGPTLSLKFDAAHIPHTKFLSQFSSTPVGFVTAKGSPLAPALSAAVNKLIATGDYARILAKWGVTDSGIPRSAINPPSSL